MDVEPVAEDAPRCGLRVAAKARSSWPPAAAMPALKCSHARRGPRSCTARDLLELEESRMTAPLMRRCPSMVPTRPAAEGEVLDSLRRSLSGEDDMPRARLRRCPPACRQSNFKGGRRPFSRPISHAQRHVRPNCPSAARPSRPPGSRIWGASVFISFGRPRKGHSLNFGLLCSFRGVK